MDDVYEDIDEYNPARKRKVLILFQAVVKELFIRCRKLNVSPVFIA